MQFFISLTVCYIKLLQITQVPLEGTNMATGNHTISAAKQFQLQRGQLSHCSSALPLPLDALAVLVFYHSYGFLKKKYINMNINIQRIS